MIRDEPALLKDVDSTPCPASAITRKHDDTIEIVRVTDAYLDD